MDENNNSKSWSQDASTKQPPKPQKRRPLKFTPRRKQILREFLTEVTGQPGKYGKINGTTWINQLLSRFGEPKGRSRAGIVSEFDVKRWMRSHEVYFAYQRAIQAYSRATEPGTPEPSPVSPPLIPREGPNEPKPKSENSSSPLQAHQIKTEPTEPSEPDPLQETNPGLDVEVRSNGIYIEIPPTYTRTRLFLVPTGWVATALPSAGSITHPTNEDPDAQDEVSDEEPHESEVQEEPYDLSGWAGSETEYEEDLFGVRED